MGGMNSILEGRSSEQLCRLRTRVERNMSCLPDLPGCWIWTGKLVNGYGSMNTHIGGKHTGLPAHRVVYELLVGPIPEGLTLDHLCRVRCCVNPNHLEPVTDKVNILRGTGMSARNIKKTHCSQGHEYTLENTRILRLQRGGLGRSCRTCANSGIHRSPEAKDRRNERRKALYWSRPDVERASAMNRYYARTAQRRA